MTIAADEDGGNILHQWVKIKFGGDGSFTAVTTAAGFPIQVLSLPDLGAASAVKITSLPDLGAGSVVKITSLPDLGAASSVKITSLPDLGAGSSVKITSLPVLGIGSIVSVSGLTSAVVSISNLPIPVSGTTIAITSLPSFAVGSILSVSGLTSASVSVNNLVAVLSSVTATGLFRITSLPDLGANSSIKITSLPALGLGSSVSISAGALISVTNLVSVLPTAPTLRFNVSTASPISGYWSATSTFSSAQTNVVLIPLSGSTTAHHITDVIFSNSSTHGNMSLLESPSNVATIREKLSRMYFVHNGGAVINFARPLVLDTNAAVCFTSRSCTGHSVTIIGYTS